VISDIRVVFQNVELLNVFYEEESKSTLLVYKGTVDGQEPHVNHEFVEDFCWVKIDDIIEKKIEIAFESSKIIIEYYAKLLKMDYKGLKESWPPECILFSFEVLMKEDPEKVKELLTRIEKKKIMLGIISSLQDRSIVVNFLGNNYSEKYGVNEDSIVGKELLTHLKPHPQSILLMCEKLGINPSFKTLYIGDSSDDIIAGKAANVTTILISTKQNRDISSDFMFYSFTSFVINTFNE